MSYFGDFYSYPPSQPLEAKGGIKASSRRGGFAEKWWGKRWIEVLESFRIGARLQRGRAYARRGQVLDLHIGPGEVSARVQGSRPKPYEAALRLKALSAAEWEGVAAVLAERPEYIARLLAGEMPREIEEVFAQAGVSLFPARRGDLKTECSYPDWSNPCKHIAAWAVLPRRLGAFPFWQGKGDLNEALAAIYRKAFLAAADSGEIWRKEGAAPAGLYRFRRSTDEAAARCTCSKAW